MEKPLFKRLVIVGVGLLGGSLGKAAREQGLASEVVGLGRDASRLEQAVACGALDRFSLEPAEAFAGADAIVLCAPPQVICSQLEAWAGLFPAGAFITDVGSVKEGIVVQAERCLPEGVNFVGSHPMAGSEKSGCTHACAEFYRNSACLLTPTAATPPRALDQARALWQALETRIVEMPPAEHDRMLAGLSHLPHVAVSALIETLGNTLGEGRVMAKLAGGGLRDTTRIAGGDPQLWTQICRENAAQIIAQLDEFIETLNVWRKILRADDHDAIFEHFGTAQQLRRDLEQNSLCNSQMRQGGKV